MKTGQLLKQNGRPVKKPGDRFYFRENDGNRTHDLKCHKLAL